MVFNFVVLQGIVAFCNIFVTFVFTLSIPQNILHVEFIAHFPHHCPHFDIHCSHMSPLQVCMLYCFIQKKFPSLHFMTMPLFLVTVPLLPVSTIYNTVYCRNYFKHGQISLPTQSKI
jgi:hypothetical protein